MNSLKLTSILRELVEGKQVGDLYHFTPMKNVPSLLSKGFIIPNYEKQISATIRPNMSIEGFKDLGYDMTNVARLMFDGNKISTKYKIRPFSNEEEDLGEEQIVVNGKNFYFLPYLKRIDLFITKETKSINTIIELLQKSNIPYKVYQGTPESNIPYKQSKEGNPKDINIKNIPEEQTYTRDQLYYPGMEIKDIPISVLNPNENYWADKESIIRNMKMKAGVSPKYPNYYVIASFSNINPLYNREGEIINVKKIPIPMYNDPKWINKFKHNLYPPVKGPIKGQIFDTYILIPKNEVK